MERMNSPARVGIVFGFFCACAAAQSNEWPLIFTVPHAADSAADSGRFHLTTEQTVFENLATSRNRIEWNKDTSTWRLHQQASVDAQREVISDSGSSPGGVSAPINLNSDLSGSFERKNLLPGGGSAGLEWKPVSYLNLRDTGSFVITNDMGPLVQWRLHDVPVLVHGGVSATAWCDSVLGNDLNATRLKDVHGDAGYYGGVAVGDSSRKFLGLPLYVNAQAFGRSIQNVGLGAINGSALFKHDIRSGDSVFAYYADSLTDGKERKWSSSQGQQYFFNTPWRIDRSFQAAGALKGKERFGLLPAIIYSYSRSTLSYPTDPHLNDVKTTGNMIQLLLGTKQGGRLEYRGGINFSWSTYDWLFGKDLSEAASAGFRTALQIDSLESKKQDYDLYVVSSDHFFLLHLLPWLRAEYKLSALRNSYTYTFSYFQNGDTVRNNEDKDLITIIHHLGLVAEQYHAFNAEFYGEYSDYIVNYLKSQWSAQSSTRNGYRLGCALAYLPSDRLHLDEHIVADVEISDYLYKMQDPGSSGKPPYSRQFSSICSGAWKLAGPWELDGRWTETYNDIGNWYGREYFPDSLKATVQSDYYAIAGKTLNYSLQLSLALAGKRARLATGCVLRENYSLSFVGSSYISAYHGYDVEPFTEMQIAFKRFVLKARLAKIMNTRERATWISRHNLDMNITGQAAW